MPIKHGGRPPRVEPGTSTQLDDTLRFWTRDSGPGIPPDAQEQLFKPFRSVCTRLLFTHSRPSRLMLIVTGVVILITL